MESNLQQFVRQFAAVVAAALAPVVLVAFLSMPMILGRHPGETPGSDPLCGRHLT